MSQYDMIYGDKIWDGVVSSCKSQWFIPGYYNTIIFYSYQTYNVK